MILFPENVKKDMVSLYQNGAMLKEISKKHNLSVVTVYNYLKDTGIIKLDDSNL